MINKKLCSGMKCCFVFTLIFCCNFSMASEDPVRPKPRFAHGMAYDRSRDRVVVFGGATGRTEQAEMFSDTWEWDGKKWQEIEISGPSPRAYSGMTYDANRRVVVLTGGRNSKNETIADTWEYDGSSWKCLQKQSPYARDHITLVYNPIRRVVLAFGGFDGAKTCGDLWQWDGHEWLLISDSGPAKRAAYGMLWDHERKTILLYGGTNIQARYSDLWEWDGRGWRSLADPYGNPNRNHFVMVYDISRQVIISFGGLNRRYLPDGTTLKLLGNKFHNLEANGPAPRFNHTMVYIESRNNIFLFGGCDRREDKYIPLNDSWVWDGTNWHPVKLGF